eukprot:1294813-Lingulodinium_polyedra.AAC.1
MSLLRLASSRPQASCCSGSVASIVATSASVRTHPQRKAKPRGGQTIVGIGPTTSKLRRAARTSACSGASGSLVADKAGVPRSDPRGGCFSHGLSWASWG